jgi:hypothetical protein
MNALAETFLVFIRRCTVLADMDLMITNKPGKEKTITELPHRKKLKPGFYRVKITCVTDNFKKIFKFSKDNIQYTHIHHCNMP